MNKDSEDSFKELVEKYVQGEITENQMKKEIENVIRRKLEGLQK